MSKFKKSHQWLYGKDVNWMGYKQTGVWGAYSAQTRHNWYGIYGIIGIRFTKRWGSDF